MKKIIYLLLPIFLLAEEKYISTEYTSLKHQNSFVNNFVSIYGKVEDKESFLDGELDLRGGLTAHGVLRKSGNFEFFNTVENSKILIHSLALDYYPSHQTLISLGRESLDLNLLNGSFDGLMAVGRFDDFSLKSFYFNHYAILYPSFYKSEEIEDGLYGLNLAYNRSFFDGELSYFSYDGNDVSDLYMAFMHNSFRMGAEHLSFTSSTLADESAYKLFAGYRYKRSYFETGYYDVYDGGLQSIYNLGGTEFKNFGLNSFLNQENAKNIYADITYNHYPIYTKLHLGQTSFKDGTQNATGDEAGLTIGFKYDDIEASATYLTQKSDQVGIFGERTDWVQTNLKYRF